MSPVFWNDVDEDDEINEIDSTNFQTYTIAVPTTAPVIHTENVVPAPEIVSLKVVISTKIVSTEKAISDNPIENADLTGNNSTVHNSNNKGKEPDANILNLTVVAANNDNNDNVKSPPGCKNLIGDLDGIQYEYDLHNNNSSVDNGADVRSNNVPDTIYGAICGRSDDANPPPLPPVHPPCPSIMLHNGINNSTGEYETICNDDVAAATAAATAAAAAAAATAAEDNNNLRAKLKLEGDSIRIKNESYGAQHHVIYDRSNAKNPPPLPPESLDDHVWNLERDRFNDDNNDFKYDDIDKEIIQFKFENLTGESETIVFYYCDDYLDATQQEDDHYSVHSELIDSTP